MDYESDDEDCDPEDEDFDSDEEDSQLGDKDDCSTTGDETDSDSDSSSDEDSQDSEDSQEAKDILREEKDPVQREVPQDTADQESQQSDGDNADEALNDGLPQTQVDDTPKPRRSRVSGPPSNPQPTVKGQSHTESTHPQVP